MLSSQIGVEKSHENKKERSDFVTFYDSTGGRKYDEKSFLNCSLENQLCILKTGSQLWLSPTWVIFGTSRKISWNMASGKLPETFQCEKGESSWSYRWSLGDSCNSMEMRFKGHRKGKNQSLLSWAKHLAAADSVNFIFLYLRFSIKHFRDFLFLFSDHFPKRKCEALLRIVCLCTCFIYFIYFVCH